VNYVAQRTVESDQAERSRRHEIDDRNLGGFDAWWWKNRQGLKPRDYASPAERERLNRVHRQKLLRARGILARRRVLPAEPAQRLTGHASLALRFKAATFKSALSSFDQELLLQGRHQRKQAL
jgi:hypothetical protein